MIACQAELHSWGSANQVAFEATKESFHILDSRRPQGDHFKILSVVFDPKLSMHTAVKDLSLEAGWRVKTLLRSSRFYDVKALIRLYKTKILSFLEGATPALFYASPSTLSNLDGIQSWFLQELHVTEESALMRFHLAPLALRRNFLMLGMLYKVSRGSASPPVQRLFCLTPRNLV